MALIKTATVISPISALPVTYGQDPAFAGGTPVDLIQVSETDLIIHPDESDPTGWLQFINCPFVIYQTVV